MKVETLNLSGMAQNSRLARSVHDADMGEFLRSNLHRYQGVVWPGSKPGMCGIASRLGAGDALRGNRKVALDGQSGYGAGGKRMSGWEHNDRKWMQHPFATNGRRLSMH